MSAENFNTRGDIGSGVPSGRPERGSSPASLGLPTFLESPLGVNPSTARRKPAGIGAGLLPEAPDGIVVTLPPSRDADLLLASVFPKGVDRFFVDSDPGKGINFQRPEFAEMHEHINGRVDALLVRPEIRNQELLDNDPFFESIGITTTEQLTEHMVKYKKKYHDANGNYYMPFTFLQVNDQLFKDKQYNWDKETHIEMILGSNRPDKLQLAMDEMRNAKYSFDVWGYVVNATSEGQTDRSQPPRHTTNIRAIEDAMTPAQRAENKEFFDEMWQFAKEEYWKVWNALDPENPYLDLENPIDILHQNEVKDGKIFHRYGHRDGGYYDLTSKLGSGKDLSLEDYRRTKEHTFIDLEMYLYKYEKDFKEHALSEAEHEKDEGHRQGYLDEATLWKQRQEKTADHVFTYHVGKDWAHHYDFVHGRQSDVETVTGFLAYPIIKERDPELAERMLKKLARDFLFPYGLALSRPETLPQRPSDEAIAQIESNPGMQETLKQLYKIEQWDGRKQFANIASQVVDSLVDERQIKEASIEELQVAADIMERTILGMLLYGENLKAQGKTVKYPEKLLVETGKMGDDSVYPDQEELSMPAGVLKKFWRFLPKVYAALGRQQNLRTDIFVASQN